MRLPLFIGLSTLTACGPSVSDQANEAAEAAVENLLVEELLAPDANSTEEVSKTGSDWVHVTDSDPMSDKKTELACVDSENSVYLSPPYGQTGARLCLRNSPQFGRDAYVALLSDGQILCRSYEPCGIRVRFDKDPAETWSGIGASDGSSDMVFIRDRASFERRLRNADATHIQMEFYRNGMQTFTFNTAGFSWDGGK